MLSVTRRLKGFFFLEHAIQFNFHFGNLHKEQIILKVQLKIYKTFSRCFSFFEVHNPSNGDQISKEFTVE